MRQVDVAQTRMGDRTAREQIRLEVAVLRIALVEQVCRNVAGGVKPIGRGSVIENRHQRLFRTLYLTPRRRIRGIRGARNRSN